MRFDISKLQEHDLNELNEAIKRTGPKVRFWYKLDNFYPFFVDEEYIIDQTEPISDFDKLHEEDKYMENDECNSRRFYFSKTRKQKGLMKLLGFRDLELCVFNPEKPLSYLEVGNKKAELVQIDGLGWGNTYEGRISFEEGYALLNEQDQDLAHELGLMFSPAGILEMDSFTHSDPEMNRDKNRTNFNIYCDNRACQKEIRNPILVIDDKTGGVYHSSICYCKDIKIKKYLGIQECFPREVSLSEAKKMFVEGLLQQSPNYKGDFIKLRSLDPWPEAAIVLRP